jgi:hypothetical protein
MCRLGVRDGWRARRVTLDRDAGSNSIVDVPEYSSVYLEEVDLVSSPAIGEDIQGHCGVWSRSTSCLSPEGRSF